MDYIQRSNLAIVEAGMASQRALLSHQGPKDAGMAGQLSGDPYRPLL